MACVLAYLHDKACRCGMQVVLRLTQMLQPSSWVQMEDAIAHVTAAVLQLSQLQPPPGISGPRGLRGRG